MAAIAAHLFLSLTNFVLPVVAGRELGAEGLGMFALLYGSVVMVAAISNGMVGDSLTVLDRHEPPIRAALASWCLLLAASAGAIAATATVATGLLSVSGGLWFGGATAAFVVKDAWRRCLMAIGAYWKLPLVDAAGLLGSVGALVTWSAGPGLDLNGVLFALFAGQILSAFVAWLTLPRGERRVSRLRGGAMRTVLQYGIWRAAQVGIQPTTLTAARLVITATAGLAAYGQLEAARLSMAPLLVMSAGLGTYLLPTFADMRTRSIAECLERADEAMRTLAATVFLFGAMFTAALPLVAPFITAGRYEISATASVGWGLYACSTTVNLAYGQLSALRARQSLATSVRSLELPVSIVLIVAASLLTVSLVPYALSVGTLVSGVAMRQFVVVPLRRSEQRQSETTDMAS